MAAEEEMGQYWPLLSPCPSLMGHPPPLPGTSEPGEPQGQRTGCEEVPSIPGQDACPLKKFPHPPESGLRLPWDPRSSAGWAWAPPPSGWGAALSHPQGHPWDSQTLLSSFLLPLGEPMQADAGLAARREQLHQLSSGMKSAIPHSPSHSPTRAGTPRASPEYNPYLWR